MRRRAGDHCGWRTVGSICRPTEDSTALAPTPPVGPQMPCLSASASDSDSDAEFDSLLTRVHFREGRDAMRSELGFKILN